MNLYRSVARVGGLWSDARLVCTLAAKSAQIQVRFDTIVPGHRLT